MRTQAWLALGLAVLAATVANAAPKPGDVVFSPGRWIEYDVGDLPLVFTAPHGGTLRPATVPDRDVEALTSPKERAQFQTAFDMNTVELTRALAEELFTQTGHRPHVVINHLSRRKLDPNRELKIAALGNPDAERAWHAFYDDLSAATAAAVVQYGFALLVDVHGHAHPIARLELGYLIDRKALALTDREFDAANAVGRSSFQHLYARLGGSGAALIRGPRSLGDLFEQRGVRAIPSPQEPRPDNESYFSAGNIVRFAGTSPSAPHVDAVQMETYRPGLRDTAENRARFARIAADVFLQFLHERYGTPPPPR